MEVEIQNLKFVGETNAHYTHDNFYDLIIVGQTIQKPNNTSFIDYVTYANMNSNWQIITPE